MAEQWEWWKEKVVALLPSLGIQWLEKKRWEAEADWKLEEREELERRGRRVQADYEEALILGEVLAAYARVMLIGAAGVGKSSLLHGLMNLPLPLAESTKLAEALMVKYEWVKAGDPDESYWNKLEEEDELMEVAKLVRIAAGSRFAQGSSEASVLASVAEAVAVKEFSPSVDVPVTTEQQADSKLQQEATKVQKSITLEILSKALHEYHKSAATAQASSQMEVIINVWDCGGQTVFLDVLPAFLTGRTMFFLMFNAKAGLESQYEDVCYHQGGVVPGSRKTQNITVLELLQKWMASIHAMLCKAPSHSAVPEYPRIIPIGTHGDDPEVREKKMEILQTLHAHCEGKAFMPLLIDSTIVNNTTAGKGKQEDTAYKYLRKQVHKFATENLAIRTPVAWFHFQKVLQQMAKQNPVVTLEQAFMVAEVCGIPVDVVPSVLSFFHELAVLFYFSSIESLCHCIIADPRWLVQQFAKLLALEGQESVPRQQLWKLLQKKGILVQHLYEEVWRGLQLPPQALVDMLEHFRLATPIDTQSQIHSIPGREYFIPSMLDCKPKCQIHPQPEKIVKQASPLHLTFSTKYVPPGFFARLVTTLIKEPTCQLVFERGVFSNQITLAYGEEVKLNEITIIEHTSTIQINFVRVAHRNPRFDPMFESTCHNIRQLIQKCSTDVCQWFPSVTVKAALQCGQCQRSEADIHYIIIPEGATTDTRMRCERNEVYCAIHSQQYWLEIPSAYEQGASSVSEPEHLSITEEVREAGKVHDLAEALEVMSFPQSVRNDPVRFLRQWCHVMGTQARSHLVHHLRGIGLEETAYRLENNEFHCAQETTSGPQHHLMDAPLSWRILTEYDLPVLTRILHDAAYKWKQIGVQLQLGRKLHNIEHTPLLIPGGPPAFLHEMLTVWLKRASPQSTLSVLSEALRSPTVGEESLANELEEEYAEPKHKKLRTQ